MAAFVALSIILMKTPSDELFNLIKSLSGQEKRQFKLFSRHNSEHLIYLQLFDSMDALEQYDEKKLFTVVNKKEEIKHVKSYLQEALLRFLEYHYFDYSIEIQLQRALQRTEVLCAKRQFSMAKKCIIKAEKTATENQQYLYLLNILSWKKKIMKYAEKILVHDEFEHEQYINELHNIDLHKNIVEYQKIDLQVRSILITRSVNLNEKAKNELTKILKSPFLKDEKMALSPRAKVHYYSILGDIHLLLKNLTKSYTCFQQLLHYFKTDIIEVYEKLIIYSRLAMILHELKEHEGLLLIKYDVVKLFKSLPKKLQVTNLYSRYLNIMVNYINYQLSALNIDEALSASDEIQEDVEKHASIQTFLVYYSNKLIISFCIPDYRKALYCFNKIVSVEKKGIRMDIFADIKIFVLILHYELGNEKLLSNLCRSAARYFSQEEEVFHIEKIMIHFFDKIICKIKTKNEKALAFVSLKKELKLHSSEKIFERFDFISWAESKIENRPLLDIFKEKILSP